MKSMDVNQNSILSSKILLVEIINSPLKFRDSIELCKSLKSQGGFAKYEDLDRGIAACSLNTLKSTSDAVLERGFVELDELRNNSLKAIEDSLIVSKSNLRNRKGLQKTLEEVQAQLSIIEKRNFLLSVIINDLRSELKEAVFKFEDPKQVERYHEINTRLEAKLSYVSENSI